LAYALGGFSTGILTTLFGMFGVIIFTNVVKLNPNYFYAGHVIYGHDHHSFLLGLTP